jgi:hypothetical protein
LAGQSEESEAVIVEPFLSWPPSEEDRSLVPLIATDGVTGKKIATLFVAIEREGWRSHPLLPIIDILTVKPQRSQSSGKTSLHLWVACG